MAALLASAQAGGPSGSQTTGPALVIAGTIILLLAFFVLVVILLIRPRLRRAGRAGRPSPVTPDPWREAGRRFKKAGD